MPQTHDQEAAAIFSSALAAELHEQRLLDGEGDPAWQIAEDRRERDWSDLESAAKDFVKVYGGAAMLRCVAEALR